MSKTDTAKIISYLENQPNVIYITKPMGTFNLEFEIMIKGSNKLFEFMKEFLSEFNLPESGLDRLIKTGYT